MKIELNPQRIFRSNKMAALALVWHTNMAAVMSRASGLLTLISQWKT